MSQVSETFYESEIFVSLFSDKERRSVTSPDQGPPPECYLKYFLHQSPPQGLLVDHPSSERFICQSVPDSPNADFFATLFDDEDGIAILSAYTVTYAQAQGMDRFPRQTVSNSWRTNKGEHIIINVVVDCPINRRPSNVNLHLILNERFFANSN